MGSDRGPTTPLAEPQRQTRRRLGFLASVLRFNTLSSTSAPTGIAPAAAGGGTTQPHATAADDGLCFMTMAEAGAKFAAKTLTPTELLQAIFDRIDRTEGTLNSFVCQMRRTAEEQAAASTERWASGAQLGPLDGMPLGVKDIFDTAGVVTAGGCYGLRDRVPDTDAPSVAMLRAAGAVFVGKTYTVEFASGGLLNPQYRSNPDGSSVVTRNPWNLGRTPGGSSSGTASALAGGEILAGTGSCTGGSIRGPCSNCNLSGIKPTYGLVSKRGVMPLSKTLDHAGPMARSALDLALFLDAIKGFDRLDECSISTADDTPSMTSTIDEPISGMTLVVVPSMLRGCSEDVLEVFAAACAVLTKELGCTIIEEEPLAGFAGEAQDVYSNVSRPEKTTYIEELPLTRPQDLSPECVEQCTQWIGSSSQRYIRAMEQRKEIEMRYEACLYDNAAAAYILPTAKTSAPPLPAEPYKDYVKRGSNVSTRHVRMCSAHIDR
jgi:aspartyl-tRNA(Asn)/glutamyl-tRNA(Gln) amidotransferase subunit A